MKKHMTLLVFPLLLLMALLTACGSQTGNIGPLNDGKAITQTSTTKLHSGGSGCYTRGSTGRSDGDYDHSTDQQGQGVNESAPYINAGFDSCADTFSLSIQTVPGYTGGTDFYQVRWARPGIGEQQFSTTSSDSTFTNAHFDTVYSFRVQGCTSHWYGGSDCTVWSDPSYIATYAPGACHPGYVWRAAGPNDGVCVTPATRDQAAYDNSQRYNRVDPNGAYGPNTCIQGYVWRAAFSGDVVCVTPATRAQTSYDNSQAFQRRY